MIIDTSALIAILRDEPDAMDYALAIEKSKNRRLSAANFVETALVIDGSRDPIASRRLDDLVTEAQIIIEPVTEAQARIAREAYRDFGKGSGHPAKLNFATALPTRSQKRPVNRCSSKAMISHAHGYHSRSEVMDVGKFAQILGAHCHAEVCATPAMRTKLPPFLNCGSRVRRPCLTAFLFPLGAPDPGAPPCIRHRFLPCTAGDLQGLSGAGLGAATLATQHRGRITQVTAGHLWRMRLARTFDGSILLTVAITDICWSVSAGGDTADLLCAGSRGVCVTLPTIACPPSLTGTCCTVTFRRCRPGDLSRPSTVKLRITRTSARRSWRPRRVKLVPGCSDLGYSPPRMAGPTDDL